MTEILLKVIEYKEVHYIPRNKEKMLGREFHRREVFEKGIELAVTFSYFNNET